MKKIDWKYNAPKLKLKGKKSAFNGNGWVLYKGNYEIFWKNCKVKEICIQGQIYTVKYERPALKLFT